jgi:hypothetical protein
MKTVLILTLAIFLVGCRTVPRDLDVRAIAIQTFGTDQNLIVHQVEYTGWLRSKISNMGSRDDYALWTDIQPATANDVNLAVWCGSSSVAAKALLRALQYPGIKKLPHLHLLFVGDVKDAEAVRPAVEATGATFYFHQR